METQETIELTVSITALDPSEEFDVEETMEAVANALTEEYKEHGYVVVVGHRERAEP